jgi:hypothetical protein
MGEGESDQVGALRGSIGQGNGRVILIASLLAFAAPDRALAADAAPAVKRLSITGTVVDPAGKPIADVMVFAADASTDAVAAVAASDAEGKVVLVLPQRRYNFGVLSPRFGVTQLVPRGPGRFQLVVASLPGNPIDGAAGEPAARIDAPRGLLLRGRVVDETGVGLEGVRLEASRESGAVIATVFSGNDGTFALAVPGGKFGLRATAPGLASVRSAHQGGRLVVVMGISAEAQPVTITEGRVFTIRPGDSIDPEYTPPAPVRALLRFAYGICPARTPMRAQDKRGLQKYWYLDVLRRTPPNPATISTVACTPASAYQPGSVPRTNIGGFDIWNDAVPAGPYMQANNGNRLILPDEP